MMNKVSGFFIVISYLILLIGCSSSEIKNADMIHSFTFGLFGHDAFNFCRERVPNFIKRYPSGTNPSRICIRYQYYTCHVNHYCNGDKNCEKEAAQYWTPIWQGTENDLVKRVEFTKQKCDLELKRNSVEKR